MDVIRKFLEQRKLVLEQREMEQRDEKEKNLEQRELELEIDQG